MDDTMPTPDEGTPAPGSGATVPEQLANTARQDGAVSSTGEGRPYDDSVNELTTGAEQAADKAAHGGGPDSEWGREGN
jgi:hypothetical protein